MKFTLEINCDNAAFQPVHDDSSESERYGAAACEVSRILREGLPQAVCAAALPQPGCVGDRSGFLRDANGARCGQWSMSDMDAEPVRHARETLDQMRARHAAELAAQPRRAVAPSPLALWFVEANDRQWDLFVWAPDVQAAIHLWRDEFGAENPRRVWKLPLGAPDAARAIHWYKPDADGIFPTCDFGES